MNNQTESSLHQSKRIRTPQINSPEGRQYMLYLVRSVLLKMKFEENKKGGPKQGAHQE